MCPRSSITAVAALSFLAVLAGCDRNGPATPATAPAGARDPRRTIADLVALRADRRYEPMVPLIVGNRGGHVTSLLTAVDAFLGANRQLRTYLRDEVGFRLGEIVDYSALAKHLDIFSEHVTLYDVRIENARAFVSYTVDHQLPAREAELVRVDGTWRYDPGTGFHPELPRAFREMAKGLRRVEEDLRSGLISPDRARQDPEAFAEEVAVRLRPGVRLLRGPD